MNASDKPALLSHEGRVVLLALLAGFPGSAIALWMLWSGDVSTKVQWTLTVLIVGAWLGVAFAVRERVVFPLQTLSNLLWAAFGVNRPREVMRGMGRTAPSAMNSQDIELDVILPTGVYVYDAEQNLLHPILAGDLRASMLTEAEARAHVTILYVANAKDTFAQVDTGFIGQNVYLFAASEGLSAWFYTVKADRVTAALKLPDTRLPLYAQAVGYPPAPLK